MSMNKVILSGHLGAKPEIKYTQSGQPVSNFRMATNESWTDKSGEKKERTEWHAIVYWGKPAEEFVKSTDKGSFITLIGSLTTRSYEDKDGKTKYVTEVKADEVGYAKSQ